VSDATRRSRLENLRAELQEISEIGSDAAAVVKLDQSRVGRLSRMDALQSQAVAQASAGRRVEMLREVEGALKRLDAGCYGACLGCEESIDPRRLDADPTATLCIRCAAEREG
jgi:DnaK suppressor protein